MAIRKKIEFESVDNLFLDPLNPRLGRHFTETKPNQDKILEKMKEFVLDELADSFIDSGFWPQEPLIVVREPLLIGRDHAPKLVVVEGNRRLAAVRLLFAAKAGKEKQKKWKEIAASATKESLDELRQLPYMISDTRDEVNAYLGFRHVTGIKEWSPAEKAEFIARLVDAGRSYKEVARLIGSNTDPVRRNYIAFKLLKQMEDAGEDMPLEDVEDRFSILSLSLRTPGVQSFLGLSLNAAPAEARVPANPPERDNLRDFALWTFGNKSEGIEPILPESRKVDDFGKVLGSREAVDYMRKTANATFDNAYRIAGGDVSELIKMINQASHEIGRALSTIHHHNTEPLVIKAVQRLEKDVNQLLLSFKNVKSPKAEGSPDA